MCQNVPMPISGVPCVAAAGYYSHSARPAMRTVSVLCCCMASSRIALHHVLYTVRASTLRAVRVYSIGQAA